MERVTDLQLQLDAAEKKIGYLKRAMARMEKRLERQEKLDEMNRYQTKWAIKKVEEARHLAEQASLAKTEFLANMSHEIRTPLNIVMGMGELLAGTDLDGTQGQYLQSLRLSSEHLLKLFDDILEFSRIESGSIEIESMPFDLKQLVVGIEAMGAHMASEKGIDFVLEYDSSLELNRVGDSRKIRQVLLNLLGNAVKFTDSGNVTLSVTALHGDEHDHIVFTVTDTGIGIPENKREQIFERFAQIEPDGVRSRSGVGLGLAISERLVDGMGGKMNLDSEVGRGSSFYVTIRLPFARESEQLPGQPDIDVDSFDFSSLRVLVADDINLNFEVIRNYLKDLPVDLDYAENGREALEMFSGESYSAVLMDIRMPVLDGVAAVRNIRRLERFKGDEPKPIIAMTAHAFSEQEEIYLSAGFNEVLIKPFSRKELLITLMHQVKQNDVERGGGDTVEFVTAGHETENSLEAMLPMVIDSIVGDIDVIRRALDNNNPDLLKQVCHAVKGVAGFYGLTRLSNLLEHLEESAEKREFRTAYALAGALGSHVSELKGKKR